jgi:hypothetical protein
MAGSISQQVKSSVRPTVGKHIRLIEKTNIEKRRSFTIMRLTENGEQDVPRVSATQEKNGCGLFRSKIPRQAYRRSIANGVKKVFSWINKWMSHCLVQCEIGSGT